MGFGKYVTRHTIRGGRDLKNVLTNRMIAAKSSMEDTADGTTYPSMVLPTNYVRYVTR